MASKQNKPKTVNYPVKTTDLSKQGSARVKVALSLFAVIHLFAVFAAPWAMPQPSSQLARQINEIMSPWTNVLYMRHGYRFFAPDPGPSHLILYEVTTEDGKTVSGKFPDRDRHLPRLLYHRFFMISEHFWGLGITNTISSQQQVADLRRAESYLRENGLVSQADWMLQNLPPVNLEGPTDEEIHNLVEELKLQGRHHAARTAERELRDQRKEMKLAKRHREVWLRGIANYLKKIHDGTSVRIWIQEHLIPNYDHIRDGGKLNDTQNFGPRQLVFSEDEEIQ